MVERVKFQCPQCHAGFNVDSKFAGRPCRCKTCGQQFRVPSRSAADQHPAAKPEPAFAGVGAAREMAAAAERNAPATAAVPAPTDWIHAVTSQLHLKQISDPRMKVVDRVHRRHLDDDDGQVGPYQIGSMPSLPALQPKKEGLGKKARHVYKNEMRIVQKILRKTNEAVLEWSIPFFILMPVGFILKKHWMAMFGLTVMILMNLLRLGVGLANLLVIPFRESPMTGLKFLIPPFTISYLNQNWYKCEKPVKRIISPVCFLLGLFLVYVFVPWFQDPDAKHRVKMIRDESGNLVPAPKDQQPSPSIEDKLKKGYENLRHDMGKQIDETKDQLPTARRHLEKAANEAIGKAKDVTEQVQDAAKGLQEKRNTDAKPVEANP